MGPKALTGWNQCHCEDYQILIPMIFHGPKLELKQSRCHKNQDNASIDAPLTSKNHNFWSTVEFLWSKPFQKQEVKAFPEMSRSTWSKEVWGWHPFKGYRRPYKGHYLEIRFGAIKSPGSLQTKGGSHFFFFLSFILYLVFLHIFLPSKHQNTHKNHKKKNKNKKSTSKVLDSSLFTKNTRYYSYTQSSFSWFYT